MKKGLFKGWEIVLLILLVAAFYPIEKVRKKRIRWSFVFVTLALLLLVARIVWEALKTQP